MNNNYIIESLIVNNNQTLDIDWINKAAAKDYAQDDERIMSLFKEAIFTDLDGQAILESAKVSKVGRFFINTLGWRKFYHFFQGKTTLEITKNLLRNYLNQRKLYFEASESGIKAALRRNPLPGSPDQIVLPENVIAKIVDEVKQESLNLRILSHVRDQQQLKANIDEKLKPYLSELEAQKKKEHEIEELAKLFDPWLKKVKSILGEESYNVLKAKLDKKVTHALQNKEATPQTLLKEIQNELSSVLYDQHKNDHERLRAAYLHWLDCIGCLKAFLYGIDPNMELARFKERLDESSIFPPSRVAAGQRATFVEKFKRTRQVLTIRPRQHPKILEKVADSLNEHEKKYSKANSPSQNLANVTPYIDKQDIEDVFGDLNEVLAVSQKSDKELLQAINNYELFFRIASKWLEKMPGDSPLLLASTQLNQAQSKVKHLEELERELHQIKPPGQAVEVEKVEAKVEEVKPLEQPAVEKIAAVPATIVLPVTDDTGEWDNLLSQQTLPEYLFDGGLLLRHIYTYPNFEQFRAAFINLLSGLQKNPLQKTILEQQISDAFEKIKPFVISLQGVQAPGRIVPVPFEKDSGARQIMKTLHDLPIIQLFLRDRLALDQLIGSKDRMTAITFPLALFLKLTLLKEKFLPSLIPFMDEFYEGFMNSCLDEKKLPSIKKGLEENLRAFEAPIIGTAISAMLKVVGGLNFLGLLEPIERSLKTIVKRLVKLINSDRILSYTNDAIKERQEDIVRLEETKKLKLASFKGSEAALEDLKLFYDNINAQILEELEDLKSARANFQKLTSEIPEFFEILHNVIAGFMDNHKITPFVKAFRNYRNFLFELKDFIEELPKIQKISNDQKRHAALLKAQSRCRVAYEHLKSELTNALTGMLEEVSSNPLESHLFSLFAAQLVRVELDPTNPDLTLAAWQKIAAPALENLFNAPDLFAGPDQR